MTVKMLLDTVTSQQTEPTTIISSIIKNDSFCKAFTKKSSQGFATRKICAKTYEKLRKSSNFYGVVLKMLLNVVKI